MRVGGGRTADALLTAEQKYDLWQRMLTGQITTVEAATEAGIDRSTVMTLRKTARDGAIAEQVGSLTRTQCHSCCNISEGSLGSHPARP